MFVTIGSLHEILFNHLPQAQIIGIQYNILAKRMVLPAPTGWVLRLSVEVDPAVAITVSEANFTQ